MPATLVASTAWPIICLGPGDLEDRERGCRPDGFVPDPNRLDNRPVLVTPRPGVDRENLRQTLRTLHIAALNLRGSSTAGKRYTAYLAWVANAVRQLRSQVSTADLDRLVLTRRYWLLQSTTFGLPPALLADLVDTEIDERELVLRETVQALEEQIERWTIPGRFVVADSSFYLRHPAKLEDADLAHELGLREAPIHLILPIVVVDELDGLKQAGNATVRWRAGYTLAVLDRVLRTASGPARLRERDFSALESGGIPRGQITVEIMLDPPGHTRLPINDDEIIDRTLAIRSLAAREVILLTYDTGQATRARSVDLNVVKLSLALEDEPKTENRPQQPKSSRPRKAERHSDGAPPS